MFSDGTHEQLIGHIEAIGACVAIFERDIDSHFSFVTCNKLFEQITFRDISQTLGNTVTDVLPRHIASAFSDSLHDCMTSQKTVQSELATDFEGSVRWWRVTFYPIFDDKEYVKRALFTAIEINEQKLFENEQDILRRRYEAVVEAAYDGIITVDDKHVIQLSNKAAEEIFKISHKDIIGTKLETLIPVPSREKHEVFMHAFKRSSDQSRPMESRGNVRGLRKDGSEFPAEVSISKIEVGENREVMAVVRDITERASMIEKLEIAASQDPLTKACNRRFMAALLNTEWERARRYNHIFSLAMIDLDKFKAVNDVFGHDCGDKVLIKISQFIKERIRDADVLCRWGGEEFLILLPETDIRSAHKAIDRYRSAFEEINIQYKDQQVVVTFSAGVAAFHKNDGSIEDIIERADIALYKAKKFGRNQVCSMDFNYPDAVN